LLIYYTFGTTALFFFARTRSAKASGIVKWWSYGVAIAFQFLYTLLTTIAEGLLNSEKVHAIKYLKIWVAANVFREFANVIILGVILLDVVPAVQRYSGLTRINPSRFAHAIYLGFLAVFVLVWEVIWNYDLIHNVKGEKIVDRKNGVGATYLTLYLVGALTAASHLLHSHYSAFRSKIPGRSLFLYAHLLAFSIVFFALWEFIPFFAYQVVKRKYTTKASSAFVILGLIFQGAVYALVALIAGSKTLEAESQRSGIAHDEKASHAANPPAGVAVEQA